MFHIIYVPHHLCAPFLQISIMDMSKQESSKHSLPPVGVRQQSIGHHFSPHLSSSQPKTPVPQSPAVAPGKGNGNGEQQSPFQQFPVHQGQDQPAGPHQQDPQQSNISGKHFPSTFTYTLHVYEEVPILYAFFILSVGQSKEH